MSFHTSNLNSVFRTLVISGACSAVIASNPSESYLRRAEVWLNKGRPADAILSLDRYLSGNRGDTYAWMLRSKCSQSLNKPGEALADLAKALQTNPRAWWAYNDRGRIYLKGGEYRKAESDFVRVLSLNPSTKKTYILRANARAMNGNLRGAVEDIQRALELSTGGYRVGEDLKVDLSKCLSDGRKSAGAGARLQDAQIKLAIAELSTGDYQSAADRLEAAKKKKALPPFALVLLSDAQSLAGQRDRALKTAGDAVEAAPMDELCVIALPQLYYRIGAIDRAAVDLKTRMARHPKSAPLHLALAQVLDLLDDGAGAMQQIDQAIKLDGRLPSLFVKRAQLYVAGGKRKEAVADLGRALALRPADYDTLLNRARCYFEMNDLKSALADLNVVVKAEYNLSRSLSARADCYARLGRAADAARDREQVHEAGD